MYEYMEKPKQNKVKAAKKEGQKPKGISVPSVPLQMSKITIPVHAGGENKISYGPVMQMAKAEVWIGGRNRTEWCGNCPKGGRGGFTHAEQKAWSDSARNRAKNDIDRGGNVIIEFRIDSLVCPGCMDWFETTFWDEIQGYIATSHNPVNVTINITYTGTGTTIQLTGPDIDWTGVGDV